MIEGASGVIGYCEIDYEDSWLDIGARIIAGDPIGNVIPVLKKDKGNGITKLHLEHYVTGTREHVTWVLDTPKPTELLDPRSLLEKILNENV